MPGMIGAVSRALAILFIAFCVCTVVEATLRAAARSEPGHKGKCPDEFEDFHDLQVKRGANS
jgi:hypothetical protein